MTIDITKEKSIAYKKAINIYQNKAKALKLGHVSLADELDKMEPKNLITAIENLLLTTRHKQGFTWAPHQFNFFGCKIKINHGSRLRAELENTKNSLTLKLFTKIDTLLNTTHESANFDDLIILYENAKKIFGDFELDTVEDLLKTASKYKEQNIWTSSIFFYIHYIEKLLEQDNLTWEDFEKLHSTCEMIESHLNSSITPEYINILRHRINERQADDLLNHIYRQYSGKDIQAQDNANNFYDIDLYVDFLATKATKAIKLLSKGLNPFDKLTNAKKDTAYETELVSVHYIDLEDSEIEKLPSKIKESNLHEDTNVIFTNKVLDYFEFYKSNKHNEDTLVNSCLIQRFCDTHKKQALLSKPEFIQNMEYYSENCFFQKNNSMICDATTVLELANIQSKQIIDKDKSNEISSPSIYGFIYTVINWFKTIWKNNTNIDNTHIINDFLKLEKYSKFPHILEIASYHRKMMPSHNTKLSS